MQNDNEMTMTCKLKFSDSEMTTSVVSQSVSVSDRASVFDAHFDRAQQFVSVSDENVDENVDEVGDEKMIWLLGIEGQDKLRFVHGSVKSGIFSVTFLRDSFTL